jgi:hypothetical protein
VPFSLGVLLATGLTREVADGVADATTSEKKVKKTQ